MTTDLQTAIADTVNEVRGQNYLVPSITNSVTIDFVANSQLAVGGSAAMLYLPDEVEGIIPNSNAFYINLGTILPVYKHTVPIAAQALTKAEQPYVLDPVGIGLGSLRTTLLEFMKTAPPTIIRGNASEIITLAKLWEVDATSTATPRGVDSTAGVLESKTAAQKLASLINGAVFVSGEQDLITDGEQTILVSGGTDLMEKVTGFGCSLGGVTAVYLAHTTPFLAALTASCIYKGAANRAYTQSQAPASFKTHFIDNLYMLEGAAVAAVPLEIID